MRTLIRVTLPGAACAATLPDNLWPTLVCRALARLNTEAAYFFADRGARCGLIIANLQDVSEIPAIAEALSATFHAKVEFVPLMTADEAAHAPLGQQWALAMS